MDVMITKDNGDSLKFGDLGINVKDFNVGSIPVSGLYGDVEGRAGTVDYGADLGQRTISVPFFMKANDLHGYPLIRDKLFSLVTSTEPFYIHELRRIEYQTGDNLVIGGKRYKVRTSGEFDIDQAFKYGFGEISFETTDLPYAESIGTTLDIERDGLSSESSIWGFGMGLLANDESFKYVHTAKSGSTFRIYNASNVEVHPFMQELRIVVRNVNRSSSFFELRNETNGSSIRVTEQVGDNKIITVDGPNILIDNLVALRRTNRKYIQLSPGWNVFSIDGATSADISFDFRFYYL